jgi:hypothetical protein
LQSLQRPVVECIQVQGVRVAKESGYGSTRVCRVDQGEAAFPLQESKHRCNWLAPAKRRVADIGGVIPRPVESLPRAPVPAVPLPWTPERLCPRLNAYGTADIIVGKIAVQRLPQRSLIPHDHVVQALASDGAHQPLRKGILPGGSRCSKHFLDSHIVGHGREVCSVDGMSIAQHISGCLVPVPASAAWSTPAWDVPSPRSALPGVAHATARQRRTGPGRWPLAR